MINEVNSETGRGEKSRYAKPVLVRYGSVRELTQAGYSGHEENKPPPCNPNANSFSVNCD